jgi:hypothetical protein
MEIQAKIQLFLLEFFRFSNGYQEPGPGSGFDLRPDQISVVDPDPADPDRYQCQASKKVDKLCILFSTKFQFAVQNT